MDCNSKKVYKRQSKTCHHCGKSMKNLSRHKKEVHHMTKIKRKLDEYVTGEKKNPKRLVKFCPLSPCKYRISGHFQLHKHLTSGIHNLNPKTSMYLETLRNAKRVSISDVESHVKKLKKRANSKRKRKAKIRQDEEYNVIAGTSRKRKRKEMIRPSRGKSRKQILTDTDGMCSDEGIETKAEKKRHEGGKSERKLEKDVSSDIGSDEEYNLTAAKVWERIRNENKCTSTSVRYPEVLDDDNQDNSIYSDDSDDESDTGSDKSQEMLSGDVYEANSCTVKELELTDCQQPNTMSNSERTKDNLDVVEIVSDSDRTDESDTEYIPDEELSTAEYDEVDDSDSSGSIGTSSSILQEKDENLIEFIEIIGEENCYGGSFLDVDVDWHRSVMQFIKKKRQQRYIFKTPTESEHDLRVRAAEPLQEEEEFYLYDESDDDDALDQEWVPSESELIAEPTNEKGETCNALLVEFTSWLMDVDGGYRNEKIVQQYKSQVQSVIRKLKTFATEDQAKLSDIELLTIEGQEGVILLRKWLSHASQEYQPGTVRSYLMSLRLFFKFLVQEGKSNVLDILNARRDLMTSWSAAQKKKVLKRKLEKRDADYVKLVSSENLYTICHGNQRINTIKQLGTTSEQTDRGNNVHLLLNDKQHCEVRDWLITRLIIDNSGRSGVAANITVEEFKDGVLYPATDEDGERYRVLVKNHKTAYVYGAAIVWIYAELHKLIDIYIRTVRSQFTEMNNEPIQELFITSNGMPLTSSQVSTSIWRTFQREGIAIKGRVSATTIRKSLATGVHVHMPEEQDKLAALAQHKPQTQANYYRVHDKVIEADLGRRAVRKYVCMDANAKKQNVVVTHVEWTVGETECLQNIFADDIHTGNITESRVREKLGASKILEHHTLKAVVLKIRRLRGAFMSSVNPPIEEEQPVVKVQRFLSSSPSVSSVAPVTESTRTWCKFTNAQTELITELTDDMIKSDAVKREVVWKRLKEDERSYKLGLLSAEPEDEEQEAKRKQRLNDKVRQEARHYKKMSKKSKSKM